MDFSSANSALWNPIIQMGVLAGLILLANTLRRKITLIRNSLMPTAVLAGFLLLFLRSAGLMPISSDFLETMTYHGIALGFIALALRVPQKNAQESGVHPSQNGALIVSTYLVQAAVGLIVSMGVAYTINRISSKPAVFCWLWVMARALARPTMLVQPTKLWAW